VGHIKAVDGVSLSIAPGRTLGVVGESGSGKSTLALALLRLLPSEGTITLNGQRIDGLKPRAVRPLRRHISEGLEIHENTSAETRMAQVAAALKDVGLDVGMLDRYPHEFSGGQRQRIAIARALVLRPKVLILDEPTSALDVSVQAQLIELLHTLQARTGMAYVFISHDLRVIRAMADEVIVMKDGRLREAGPTEAILTAPQDPYTKALIAAAFELKAF
jgi:microcin C transport system ATP-binding protein